MGISENIKGQTINQYGFLPDIMATCQELAKTQHPRDYNGNKIKPISGKSLLPIFSGSTEEIHDEPIFWEHEGNKAVRLGNYKLVQDWEKGNPNNWELYNLTTDRTEQNNLISQLPDKANEMIAMYNEWANQLKVLPWAEVEDILKNKK